MESYWAPEIVHLYGKNITQMRDLYEFVDFGCQRTLAGFFCSIKQRFALTAFSRTWITLGLW